MRSPQNDSVKIKPPDKGSSVVVWDRLDYLKEVKPQLSDSSISIRKLKLLKKILWIQLMKATKSLERRNIIQEKEKNYFKFNFRKATKCLKVLLTT